MLQNQNPFFELSSQLDRIEKSLAHITEVKNKTSQDDSLLTIDEAALFLKIPKKTLYQYTSKRIIPYKKPRKKLLFKKEDLLSWLNSHSK